MYCHFFGFRPLTFAVNSCRVFDGLWPGRGEDWEEACDWAGEGFGEEEGGAELTGGALLGVHTGVEGWAV